MGFAKKTGEKTWVASAPSNIALIKYMGKIDSASGGTSNRPTNTSLSYTLPHLLSYVSLEADATGSADTWSPLETYGDLKFAKLQLSEKGAARFLAHLQKMKDQFGYKGAFKIRSANGFPSDCGLASSASSFAALTMAAMEALPALTGRAQPSVLEAAEWSRRGSGSSSRSFFAPWSIWDAEGAREAQNLGYGELIHQVVIVNEENKAVSSSEAHRRVVTSELFKGRPERAESRARNLMQALRSRDWAQAFEITWAEFWDMHALFETSRPSFGYMTAGSLEVLRRVRELTWDRTGDGPIVTMDAGPNVHLMYRVDEKGLAQAQAVQAAFAGRYPVYSSPHVQSNAKPNEKPNEKPNAKSNAKSNEKLGTR
jgi:diphosphomevalonate decarboxylase